MLDVDGPLSAKVSAAKSSEAPLAEGAARGINLHQRSLSDSSPRPADLGFRAPGFEPPSAYRISGYLPSNSGGPTAPRRNTQAGKKVSTSNAPRPSVINADTSKLVLTDGRILDKSSAYHRLSDTNLALSGNRLKSLPYSARRASSGDLTELDRARLKKDYAPLDEENGVVESSEEEDRSSDEERHRGRNKETRDRSGSGSKTLSIGRRKAPRSPLGQSVVAGENGTLQ